VIWNAIFGTLALTSFGLTLWQWLVARKFPLHQRSTNAPVLKSAIPPSLTVLKPLKGQDCFTEECLRSWLAQDYAGELQFLFVVDPADELVCATVRRLLVEFPQHDAQLVICTERLGENAKVSKLAFVEPSVRHQVLAVSDADMFVPPDFLIHAVAPLNTTDVGMVTSFYQLTTPGTLAHRCEAVAINADFWSQVLQARSLRPLDFALGAVMIFRRAALAELGGFRVLANRLADDYQLGQHVTRRGARIELCPLVAECRESPRGWSAVWRHQLRWARTIRVCAPRQYFASILANVTLWSALWLALDPGSLQKSLAAACLLARVAVAVDLQRRLTRSGTALGAAWLVPLKDALQVALWLGAFLGNRIEWRGETFRVRRDGVLEPDAPTPNRAR